MDNIRDSFSRLKKKIKHPLRRTRHKPDGAGSDASGERTASSSPLPRPEPPVVVGGDHDRGGNGTNADRRQVRSTDRAPESLPAGGSDNDRQRGEVDVDGREASQRSSRLDPDANVDVALRIRLGREVEGVHPSPSAPPIPHSGKPDSV